MASPLCLQLVILMLLVLTVCGCIEKEKHALLKFKQGFIHPYCLSSWMEEEEEEDCCLWSGLTCNNKTGHVTTLDLSFCALSFIINTTDSMIPLLDLPKLKYLDLTFNFFNHTPIPEFLGSLTQLRYLKLGASEFGGRFPYQIGNLSKLRHLDLAANFLQGTIPNVFNKMTSLESLYVSSNNFTGYLPESIKQLSNLVAFYAESNSLVGVISESFLNNFPKLQELFISSNSFTCNLSNDWIPPLELNSIGMSSCSLGPKFPAWLQHLKGITYLDLSQNGIIGAIPSWYWNLTSNMATMNLSYNHITGNPSMLSLVAQNVSMDTVGQNFLTYLNYIDLTSNLLDGPIPQISHKIVYLSLSKNLFSGTISNFLCTARRGVDNSLRLLDLSENNLSGRIPDCLMRWPNINILSVADNDFSGEIPSSIGHMRHMQMLFLRNNNLLGEIFLPLRNLTQLLVIDVANNGLSGNIPPWIGELGQLQILMLHSNQLDGYVTSSLCLLNHLQILDLADNSIQGSIPHCLGNFSRMVTSDTPDNMSTDVMVAGYQYSANIILVWKGREYKYQEILRFVRMIDVSNNKLSGVIPDAVINLLGLVALNLSRNHLSGTIPNRIGNLQNLDFLDFSRNHLSGALPLSLSNLTLLNLFNCSYNDLSGAIPRSTQLQSFDMSSFIGNAKLCGPPLLVKCETSRTSDEGPSLIKGDHGMDNSWFYIGLGVGYIVGLWGVCATLLFNHSWRIAYFRFVQIVQDWIYVVTILNVRKFQRVFV